MNLLGQLTLDGACQTAYLKQRDRPQVVYEKDNGAFDSMAYHMWKVLKPGRGVFMVESVRVGMRVGAVPGEPPPRPVGPEELVKRLTKLVNYHIGVYYKEARQEIEDCEFDHLYRQLRDLEEKHPELLDSNSPTQRVGSDI